MTSSKRTKLTEKGLVEAAGEAHVEHGGELEAEEEDPVAAVEADL